MQFQLPEMLKQRPKQFWGLLKSKATQDIDMLIREFTEFNENFFYDPKIAQDTFRPLTDPQPHHITAAELTHILTHHFKADKSSGLSPLPLQLLKHMGPAGVRCLAQLLNCSAIDQLAPTLWRTSKVTPLYKGKGDATLPENYRSLAVAPPLSKLFILSVNVLKTCKRAENQIFRLVLL